MSSVITVSLINKGIGRVICPTCGHSPMDVESHRNLGGGALFICTCSICGCMVQKNVEPPTNETSIQVLLESSFEEEVQNFAQIMTRGIPNTSGQLTCLFCKISIPNGGSILCDSCQQKFINFLKEEMKNG